MSPSRALRIGSRGSDLALWQARHVQSLLQARYPGREFPIEIIRTSGDRIQDRALYKIEDKGFFTKEIEDALLAERVDIAVHSLKDLPTESPDVLAVAAIPEREDPHDVWLSRDGLGPMEIAQGARVGTSSLRRQAQLRALRGDLRFEDLRGNVPTRVRKLFDGEYDAVVLARAGLHRLGLLPGNAVLLPFEQVLPAPGQGALAIQVRRDDEESFAQVSVLEDADARLAVTAERTFLNRLQGGCLVPVGAHAEMRAGSLRLRGMVADLTGEPIFRGEETAEIGEGAERILAGGQSGGGAGSPRVEQAAALGLRLADRLLGDGAGPVLDRVREFLRSQTSRGGGEA